GLDGREQRRDHGGAPARDRCEARRRRHLRLHGMTWSRRFRLRQHLQSSVWAWPVLGALLGAAAAPLDIWLEPHVSLPAAWSYTPSTATTVLTTVVGAAAALTGFVVTVSVLVV